MEKNASTQVITTFREYAERARRSARAEGATVLSFALGQVVGFTDQLINDMETADLAETGLIYDLLGAQVAKLYGWGADESAAALIEFCDDREARQLIGSRATARPAVLAALRESVVWITVTYSADGAHGERVIALVRRDGPGPLKSLQIKHRLDWDDLPPRPRARLIENSNTPLRYQYYPVPAGAGSEG